MTANEQWQKNTADPLGLGELESIEPGYDGWDEIETALNAHKQGRRNRRRTGGWLAMAASLVLVVTVTLLRQQEPPVIHTNKSATLAANPASVTVQDNVEALIGLSQTMEEQVLNLRQDSGSMPANTAIYVAEIEDLIAQVDGELSRNPDSVDLWGQRVNLMLDLAQIYQQQWEVDYGRMASL